MKKIKSYRYGEIVQLTNGDVCLFKRVNSMRHRMIRLNSISYGVDAGLYDISKLSYGIRKVIFFETDTKRVYEISVDDFDNKNFRFDFGYGLQRFIPIKELKPAEYPN